MAYVLKKSPRSKKKWRITTPNGKNIDFGASGYSDYTLHKDPSRQENYLARHRPRENWEKSGINTAGFWSRWLLWNIPDFQESIRDIENRFGITIDYQENNSNNSKDYVEDMRNMKDEELISYCDANDRKECHDEKFWESETKRRYKNVEINKPETMTWKEYFRWQLATDKYNN